MTRLHAKRVSPYTCGWLYFNGLGYDTLHNTNLGGYLWFVAYGGRSNIPFRGDILERYITAYFYD